jgi:hypothetical protein
VLPIGGDDAFQLVPELVHRVDFRRLLGQLQESDVEFARQRCVRRSVWPLARSASNQIVPHAR